jgi:hypothetical protein
MTAILILMLWEPQVSHSDTLESLVCRSFHLQMLIYHQMRQRDDHVSNSVTCFTARNKIHYQKLHIVIVLLPQKNIRILCSSTTTVTSPMDERAWQFSLLTHSAIPPSAPSHLCPSAWIACCYDSTLTVQVEQKMMRQPVWDLFLWPQYNTLVLSPEMLQLCNSCSCHVRITHSRKFVRSY